MAVWNLTELSSVTLFDRIDGEHYLPEYISNQDTLSKIETASLPQWFLVSDGNHLSVSKHFSDSGEIPYFRGQDITDFFLENANPIRIPKRIYETPMMQRSHFHTGDVLLSIVGTIGSLSVVPETIGAATGSCKIAILRSKGECSPFVLAAFLISKYGQLQIKRNTRGAVQMGLILKDLSRIRVPNFPDFQQADIEALIKQSISANRQSKMLYTQAKQLLEAGLGLDKMRFDKPVGYTARFSTVGLSETFFAKRIDSQCFAPDALFYERWLRSHVRCDRLGKLLHSTAKGRQQAESSQWNCDYCSIKHISGRELVGVSKCLLGVDTPVAGMDDLLLAITGATIGKIGIVKRYTRLAFSGDLLMLRAKPEINPNYLLLALDHRIGQVQFSRWITGSTNGHLAPRDVGRVLVPRLDESIEEQIAQLVEKSLSRRFESEQLLNQAKTRVEQLIEEAVKS